MLTQAIDDYLAIRRAAGFRFPVHEGPVTQLRALCCCA